jgi:CTLH/CRA C-terminal to LisH motif domain
MSTTRGMQALVLIEELAPGMLQQRTDVRSELNLQHFIELMRVSTSQAQHLHAMQFARERLRLDLAPKQEEVMGVCHTLAWRRAARQQS